MSHDNPPINWNVARQSEHVDTLICDYTVILGIYRHRHSYMHKIDIPEHYIPFSRISAAHLEL